MGDLILSLFKKHSTFYPFLFIAVLLFVSSEALLFLACLWVMFSYLWVSRYNILLFPDPVELTFSNTILLSIAASCLCVYSLNGNLFLFIWLILQDYYFFLCKFVSINYYVFIFQILFMQVHFILLLDYIFSCYCRYSIIRFCIYFFI